MVNFTTGTFENFGSCAFLNNGKIELIVTLDVGPRIISCSLCGKPNIFFVDKERTFKNDSDELHSFFGTGENWYIYGGHRLWSSPEKYPASYVPDNFPVAYKFDDGRLILTANPTKTGEKHSVEITLSETEPKAKILHKIENCSDKTLSLAPWAMTVMKAGGIEVFPLCTRKSGLLSNRLNVLWEYTDIKDERFFMGNHFAALKQVFGAENNFKIGTNNEDGWAAYAVDGQIFKKSFKFDNNAVYPDYGCNFETFTNGLFLECESLGAMASLKYGEAVLHEENWEVLPCDDEFNPQSDAEIAEFVLKHLINHA